MTPDAGLRVGERLRLTAQQLHRNLRHRIAHAPARAAIAVYLIAIVLTATLLTLPLATADGSITALPDAIFTAVSSITVTGLTTVDTATHWSLFGQIVILVAIQTGGLGVVTIALLLAMTVTHRLGLSSRLFAVESIGASGAVDVPRLLRVVVITTVTIEGALAVLLLPGFLAAGEPIGLALWHAVFYAISAFSNAGFTPHLDGLEGFAGNPLVLAPLTLGVFVGSFGFPVFLNLIRAKWSRRRWSLHTKLTLYTTSLLLVLGAAGWVAAEWANPETIGAEPWWQKLGHSVFASTMTRSGGFSLIDHELATNTSLLMSDALMFVGGASASTAGGIKVTTLAVLVLAILAEARGTRNTNALGRRIPTRVVRLAVSVLFLSATLVFVATAVLTTVSDAPLDRLLFEVISAFATCGLSVGISAQLGTLGQLVLAAVMVIGRIGPIVLASALALKQRTEAYTLPEERPIIG